MMRTGFLKASKTKSICVATAMVVGLTACGSDQKTTQLPRMWGGLVKGIGSGVVKKVSSVAGGADKSATAAAPKAGDTDKVVRGALAATPGPIALVVRERNAAVSAMTPVQTNGQYQTWMSAQGQSVTLRGGVLSATRGLGDDLMASELSAAAAAIQARRPGAYTRIYEHLSGQGENSVLVANCELSKVKSERVAIGEIDGNATVLREACQHPSGISFENLYWVDGSGRFLKSRQWVSQSVKYLIVQPLR